MPVYLQDEDKRRKVQQIKGETQPQTPSVSAPKTAASSAGTTKPVRAGMPKVQTERNIAAAPAYLQYQSGIHADSGGLHRKINYDFDKMTWDDVYYEAANRLRSDEERDAMVLAYQEHVGGRKQLDTLRAGVDSKKSGGAYASTKAATKAALTQERMEINAKITEKRNEQRAAQHNTITSLNNLGIIGFDGSAINWNTISFEDAVRTVRLIPDDKARKAALKGIKAMTEDGGRFASHKAYDLTDSANKYIANSDFDLAAYEKFFDGDDYSKGVRGSFSASTGDSEENRALYESYLAKIEESDMTDYQKYWYKRGLDEVYKETTGVAYADKAVEPEIATDGAPVDETAEEPEKPSASVWQVLFPKREGTTRQKEDAQAFIDGLTKDKEPAEDAPEAPSPSVEAMPAPAPTATPAPVEGVDYARIGDYASATASTEGRWVSGRLAKAQEQTPQPLQPPMQVQGPQMPQQEDAPKEAPQAVYGTVNLANDPVRAAEYALSGRGNELDQETQTMLSNLCNSSQAARWLLQGWHYDIQNLARGEGVDAQRYQNMGNTGRFAEDDIGYLIGGRLGGYYNKTRNDSFPPELTTDVIGMILGVAMDAEAAYENGRFTYDPLNETLYDGYLRENPQALANLDGAFRTIYEMKKEKREQDQLVADAAEATRQEQIISAQAAVRSGSYTQDQYDLVVENAPVVTDMDLKLDDAYVDYNAEILSFVSEKYFDPDSWINQEMVGAGFTNLNASVALDYRKYLTDSIVEQMHNDLRVAKALGYNGLEDYYARQGGFSVERIADRAKIALQQFDAEIDDDTLATAQMYTGGNDSTLEAVVGGSATGVLETSADYLEAIWTLENARKEDRPLFEQRMRNKYQTEYGISLSSYMYTQDMLAFADAHPNAEMGKYIKEYIASGADVFRLAIEPEMTWSLEAASAMNAKANALEGWAMNNLTQNAGKWFGRSRAAGSNALMQTVASLTTLATGSSSLGVAVGFGLPTIQQETEAQLAEGQSLKYGATMGLAKAVNTVLAESATSGKLTDKLASLTGINVLVETAGNVVTKSKTMNAMLGLLKSAGGQLFDELVVDEIKEGTGWQLIGKFSEEMMSGSGLITSILSGVKNLDVDQTFSDISANMTEGFWTMLPNVFISGAGGAMEGWTATRKAAQEMAQTGSTESAQKFVESFVQEVQDEGNRAELDEVCEAASLATETVGRMMTDPEITPTVETSMTETEQADAHAQEAASSQARMDADMQTMQEAQARMDAGEINPDLPAVIGSAASDYSKANQGKVEHTREEAQKRSDADRHMGEAFAAAKTKAGQTHEIQKQQLREAMSEMAVQAAERARETEVTRLQDRISSIEAQMQAEFDKGDDADFDLINNLAAQSGALSAYLEDMTAQEDGQADAEQIRSDVARRLDEIEQAREARVSAETQAVMETRERTRKLIEEQAALGGVFKKLRNDVIYVDETQAAEILYELGAKSLTEANRILGGTKLTKTKGSGTPLDGSYYAELKALAPGYFREEWDAHPESAIVSIAQKRIHLRADIDQSKQDEKAAQEAYRAKSAERYSGVSEKAAEIQPGYALSQFENENIQTSEVSTDTTNELLAGTTHEVHTHKSLEEKAAKRIADNGLKRTVADLMKLKSMSDEDIVTGKECLAILKRNGDLMRHAVLSVKLGIEGTKTGQALNVFSLFQKRSAENAAAETLEMANAYNKKKGRYAKKMDEAAMDEQLSLGETQYQPFLEERVSFGTSDPAMQKLASDVAKRSGLTLYWANMPDGMRGFFMRDKGVIVLNQKVGAAQGAYIAAIHEYTHFMEQAEQYGEYADVVLKAAYGKDYEKSKAMLEDAGAIRDAYAERGEELTDDLLRKELVASATEKILLGDEAFMRTLFTGGNGGVAVRMLGTMDRFLRSRKADDQASKQEYELIEAARVKVRDAIANAEKWKTEAQNGPQYSMQVERSITPGGDRQQAISDTDTYDQITASAPDGEIVMQEQPDVTQTEIRDPAEYDAKEVTRRVIANIEAMQADDVNADNEWGVMMNQFQRDKIDEFRLHGVTLPGLNYNRATVKQRMLCAILATPQDRVGPNGDTLTQQLKDLEAGKLAVVTEADYNYILSQAAIVEGSAVDEVGVPLAREGEQAFGRMKDAQANIQPVSLAEKTSAWRYISLLSSPVTTIKNIDGNLLIQEAERISTMGAAWIDKMVAKKTGMRTTDTARKRKPERRRRLSAEETLSTITLSRRRAPAAAATTTRAEMAAYSRTMRWRLCAMSSTSPWTRPTRCSWRRPFPRSCRFSSASRRKSAMKKRASCA